MFYSLFRFFWPHVMKNVSVNFVSSYFCKMNDYSRGLFRKLNLMRLNTSGCNLQQDVKAAVRLFKLHLTVSNLLVLGLYCPAKAAWLVTYNWPWGEPLCKFVHFCWLFAFCLSSNIVASISADRMLSVWRLCRLKDVSHFTCFLQMQTQLSLPIVTFERART